MVKASFEHEGNFGSVVLTTHFGKTCRISCQKQSDEFFRFGGTAINEVLVHEAVILDLKNSKFRAFRSGSHFEDIGILSPENWDISDLHCYATEYYPLDMEGKEHGWFLSKRPIQNAHHLFINLEVLDGGGNALRRLRISPFTGEFVELN